jgi:hypothetical protein
MDGVEMAIFGVSLYTSEEGQRGIGTGVFVYPHFECMNGG